MIRNFTDSVQAASEQYAEIQRQRLKAFHPSLEGIVDDFNILTNGLRLRPFARNQTLPAELDADSIYFISTDPGELLDLVIIDSVSMVHFKSLTSRGDANMGSRFCIAGDEDVILPRVRGKVLPHMNLEHFPNVRLAYVDTGEIGVGSYINMYFTGLDFFPKTPFFTDVMLGLVNICLNLSRRAVPNPSRPSWSNVVNDTFGAFEDEELRNSYNFFLQALPEFESPGTDGEKGATSKRLNRNTSIRGFKGSTFLEVFFEALENIAIEKEGFTADSRIWDHHFHGLGRKKEIVPLQFIQFAKKLNENFLLTAQSVGIKNAFQGRFPLHISKGRHETNQLEIQEKLDSCCDMLSSVFQLGEDKAHNISEEGKTRMFCDFGTNIFPGTGNYAVIADEDIDPWIQNVLNSSSSVETTTVQVEEEEEMTELTEEDLSEMVEMSGNVDEDEHPSEEDGAVVMQEADMQMVLQFYDPNKSTKYNMLGTKDLVSNATTGKIVLVLEREHPSGKLGKISNPREDRDVTGCQLYSPFTKFFFKEDVRADQKILNKFPTYIMDLLSSSEAVGDSLSSIRKQASSVLETIEDRLYYLIEQLKNHRSSHVRFEAYFDITKSRNIKWPDVDNLSPLRIVKHRHINEYIRDLCAKNMAPLRKFIAMELERKDNDRTNLASITADARTRLFQCSETVVLICNASVYRPIFFKEANTTHDGVYETPVNLRVELPRDVQNWTELKYGINPQYFPFRSTSIPTEPKDVGTRTTSPLSRVIASRLEGKIVVPLSYVDSLAQIRRTMLKYQRIADGTPAPTNEDSMLPFFADVDYSGIATGLSDDERKDFLVDVSRILIRLYETEWHYYLFTPKKRRSNTTPIVWPQSNNQISKFPKTAEKVERFRRLQPTCVHIKSSKTNKPINTEGMFIFSCSPKDPSFPEIEVNNVSDFLSQNSY